MDRGPTRFARIEAGDDIRGESRFDSDRILANGAIDLPPRNSRCHRSILLVESSVSDRCPASGRLTSVTPY